MNKKTTQYKRKQFNNGEIINESSNLIEKPKNPTEKSDNTDEPLFSNVFDEFFQKHLADFFMEPKSLTLPIDLMLGLSFSFGFSILIILFIFFNPFIYFATNNFPIGFLISWLAWASSLTFFGSFLEFLLKKYEANAPTWLRFSILLYFCVFACLFDIVMEHRYFDYNGVKIQVNVLNIFSVLVHIIMSGISYLIDIVHST